MEFYDNSGQGVSIVGTATTTGGNVPNGTESISFQLTGGYGAQLPDQDRPYSIEPAVLSGGGIAIQLDLQSHSPDFTI